MPYILERILRKKELQKVGVFVGNIHNTSDNNSRLLICLLRGLMIFLASYATVIGVSDAFELPYNFVTVVAFLLFISMAVALLYLNKWLFYSGYVLLLVIYTFALVYFYLYANSGYQAIINIIFEEYSDYFKLASLREAYEIYSTRYVTITVALLFIGAFLALLLNITISGYMNLAETVLITFPFLEIAFFIEKKPPLHCILILLGIYLCVGIQQASKNFRMQVKGKHTPEYIRIRLKNEYRYFYQSNVKGTVYTLLLSFLIAVTVGLCFSPLYYAEKTPTVPNTIRKELDNIVKIYIQNGISGFFNRYDAKGGVGMKGQLGGVSSVRPDFQPDINVTFVPYTTDTIYLKGFTGSYYSNNQWQPHTYDELSSPTSSPIPFLTQGEIEAYDTLYSPVTADTAQMQITNLDLFEGTVLTPYYTPNNPSSVSQGESYSVQYTPYLSTRHPVTETDLDPEYYEYIYSKCLNVPRELRPYLLSYCKEAGFGIFADSTFTDAPEDAEEELTTEKINQQRIDLAQQVYSHFIENYDYTMAPGSTPTNKDFVEYFLSEQKRGYCTYFASSAVLLLRTMGIPARYAEGYSIPNTLVSDDAKPIALATPEWHDAPAEYNDLYVVSLDVNDSYAHAWIEIYLDGYGFVPFEVTPADLDSDQGIPDLAGLFAGLFDINFTIAELPEENTDLAQINTNVFSNFFPSASAKNILVPLIVFVSVILLTLLLYCLIRAVRTHRQHSIWLKNGNYDKLISRFYAQLNTMLHARLDRCTKLKKELGPINRNLLPDELCKLMSDISNKLHLPDEQISSLNKDLEMFRFYAEKGLYSAKGLTHEEYEIFLQCFKKAKKLCKQIK